MPREGDNNATLLYERVLHGTVLNWRSPQLKFDGENLALERRFEMRQQSYYCLLPRVQPSRGVAGLIQEVAERCPHCTWWYVLYCGMKYCTVLYCISSSGSSEIWVS
jgi:hypothetical protein